MAQGGGNFPLYAGLPVFPGMQMGAFDGLLTPPTFPPPTKPLMAPSSLLHSQSELDMLLYGYARSKTPGSGHALSGLTLADFKHGAPPLCGICIPTSVHLCYTSSLLSL